jgi:DNA-binding CsgD family transcriptional regulator
VLVRSPNRALSPRQEQIIGLLALGLSDKEISARLAISPHTVRTYLDRVYQHLGCRTRTRAVALWLTDRAGSGAGIVEIGDGPGM